MGEELSARGRVVVLMGSKKDLSHGQKIASFLEKFEVSTSLRIASAHKVPELVLSILKEVKGERVVLITIAGLSNALSGFCDANTTAPVIAAPPLSDAFAGADIFSTLRMPSGVAPLTVLGAEAAALAAAKILALSEPPLRERIARYQRAKQEEILEADRKLCQKGVKAPS